MKNIWGKFSKERWVPFELKKKITGLVQDCSISIAKALEILQSKPLEYFVMSLLM